MLQSMVSLRVRHDRATKHISGTELGVGLMSHRFARLVAVGPGKQFAKSHSSWSDRV